MVDGGWRWRLLGPHRGGRVAAVAGAPHDPLVFYFGAAAGGIWKTDDAGLSWKNVSDGFLTTASVGALAVAEADSNVIYAGMGEACIRGNVSYGDGVYRSDDAGMSWRNLGLRDTRHIARVRVHPKDPDLVYVAALGHAFGPSAERGVFRSTNGGRRFERVLFRDENSGAVDLSMDPHNPRVLYAAMWDARRYPWTLVSGGPGSSLYRSVDGGENWTELTDRPGLPAGLKGRIGIACSPARTGRVWAAVEAKEGGLFRSDDGGDSWRRVSDSPDLVQRPWYYMHVFAHPTDPETVYVLNLGVWRSHNGGQHFEEVSNPYGDNHDLWIDPRSPARMILGNDGGASVTQNGGRTWSSLFNQPTGQFYHVVTDNQEWYRVYGAQQDNTTLSVPSRVDAGTISVADCYPVGGGESGYVAVRPDDPNIVYAGSYASRMTRYDHRTRSQVDITVWPEDPIGYGAGALRHRFQWTFPIVLSPHDPDRLYAAGNQVFVSGDGGQRWTAISPDLTRAEPSTLGPSGGPITKDNVSTEYYATVFAFAESPCERGLLWAGSDDGRVHVSRDNGGSWQDVTPPDLPEWALVSIIEPSPHRPLAAYLAATRYKLDDPAPYLFRTENAGATWTRIVVGIAPEDYTRVVREDPSREGLLYCGTETGVYVSYDRGDHWQPLQGGGLPVVPVHDLVVHQDALVAATHGRGFYVLDNLWPVRSGDRPGFSDELQLVAPLPAYRGAWPYIPSAGPGDRTYVHATHGDAIAEVIEDESGKVVGPLTAAENLALGLTVDYYVPDDEQTVLEMAVEDNTGYSLRRFSSSPGPEGEPRLPATRGPHRFRWNLKLPSATALADSAPLSPYWGGGLDGPELVPGRYRVRLVRGSEEQEAWFEVRPHPGSTVSAEDYTAQFQLLVAIRDKISAVHELVAASRVVRAALETWEERLSRHGAGDGDAARAAAATRAALQEAEAGLVEQRGRSRADSFNYPPKVNSKLASLQSTVAYGDGRPPEQCRAVFLHLEGEADRGMSTLRDLLEKDVPAVSRLIGEAGVDPLG
jgi:hypothetical protein